VFLLPFIILATLTYHLSLSGAKDQFRNTIMNELNSVERQFSDQITSLNEISLNITVNDSLSSFFMAHPLYGRTGAQMLNSYIASQGNINDVILYYSSEISQYYSSQGSFQLETLMRVYFNEVEVEKKHLEALFEVHEPQLVLLSKDGGTTNHVQLQYVVPVYDAQGVQQGTVLFIFKSDELTKIFPIWDEADLKRFYIINEDRHILLSNDPSNEKFLEGSGLLSADLLEHSSFKHQGVDYRVESLYSEELGLSFISIVNSQDLLQSIIEARNFVLTLLISLFILGLLLIFIASYLQYLPIKKMSLALLTKEEQAHIKAENELTYIQQRITHILNQNEILALENKSLLYISEGQALLALIEDNQAGGAQDVHPFIQELAENGFGYYVAIVKKEQLSAAAKSQIQQFFPYKNHHFQAYLIQIPLQNKYGIVVVHLTHEITLKVSLQQLEQVLSSLKENFNVYYGQLYEDLDKIKHSYIEALIACDDLTQEVTERFIPYRGEAFKYHYFLEYPVEMETKWVHSINQGTVDVAIHSMKQIINFLQENKYHGEEVKVYSYYLINLIMKTAGTLEFPREKIQLKQLTEHRTLEDLADKLLQLTRLLTQWVQAKREVTRDKFREEIFYYIGQNYRSPELSLEYLAEKYDYSAPYLSKVIKEETGMTFTKYVQDLRLNYIKEKLVETNLPIKDIINQGGYYDVSNFSRKFKKLLGITPGQYRELYRKQR